MLVWGYTPQLTAGVWVGFDDKQISLGKKKPARARRFPLARIHRRRDKPGRPVFS